MLEASPTIPQAPHTGCHQSQLPLSCNAATLWSAARSLSSVRQPTIHYIQPNKQNNSIQFMMIPLVVLEHSSSRAIFAQNVQTVTITVAYPKNDFIARRLDCAERKAIRKCRSYSLIFWCSKNNVYGLNGLCVMKWRYFYRNVVRWQVPSLAPPPCPSLVLRPPYSEALFVPPSSASRVKQMATGRISHAMSISVFF